jgi:hypothetical protein
MALARKTVPPAAVAGRYETDYSQWLTENAQLLRQGRLAEADITNIAEELEDMGRSEHRALGSQIALVLLHLLKWQFQSTHRGSSWQLSIDNGRDAITELLTDSPSMRQRVPELIESKYRISARNAATETGLSANTFPEQCPYTPEQVLAHDYFPSA